MSVRSSCLTQGQLSANKASGMSDVKIKQQLCIMQAQGAVTCEGVSFHFISFISALCPTPLRLKLRNATLFLLFLMFVFKSAPKF